MIYIEYYFFKGSNIHEIILNFQHMNMKLYPLTRAKTISFVHFFSV
jgi:hypothetical protein